MRRILSLFILGLLTIGVKNAFAEDAITTNAVNFRSGPGTRYPVLGSIPARQPIIVRTCDNNWCLINYGPRTGWTSINYIAFKTTDQLYNSYNNQQPRISLYFYGNDRWDDGFWGDPYWDYYYYRPYWHHRRPARVIPSVPARHPDMIPSTPAQPVPSGTPMQPPQMQPPQMIPSTPAFRRG